MCILMQNKNPQNQANLFRAHDCSKNHKKYDLNLIIIQTQQITNKKGE